MDDIAARLPSRIVLNSASSISLSDRFRQLKQVPKSSGHKMNGIRESRNFLYDDYMDTELVDSRGDYGRSDLQGGRSADYGLGAGAGLRGGASLRRRDLDVGLDEYAAALHRKPDGILRHRDSMDNFGGSSTGHARRFADAMGIPSSTRTQPVYDDLDYAPPARSRVIYRDAPRSRQQVVRRVVGGGRDYFDDTREVVEIVERVQRPQRRVQVLRRKVPIHQRVVKKIVVQKVVRNGGGIKRRSFGGGSKSGQDSSPRIQRRSNTGGVQKKKFEGGRGKKDSKPKLSASELDRELDEYMKSSKHARVAF